MPKDQLDHDELNDQEDDLPVLTDEKPATSQTEADNDDAPDSSDEYDIRAEMDDHDNHVLGLLTDDELAALNGDESDEEEADNTAQPDETGEHTAGEESGDEGQEADNAAQNATTEAQPAPFELTQEQIDQINAEAKAARQEALDKWRDGDMTDDELQAAIDAAEQAKEEARAAAYEQAEQAKAEAAFEARKASFMEDARTYLTMDYPDLAKPEHLQEFDRHVRSVTASPRFEGKSNREMLEAAHRLYAAEAEVLGIAVPRLKSAAKSDAKPEPKTETPAKPAKRSKPEVVPTLAKVPAAATNSAADGKWGSIAARYAAADRDGDVAAMERIMASLSDEEREAFASMEI